MQAHRRAVAAVVDDIASELERLGLWAPVPPAAARFDSGVPFSCDTLDWHQWLQWRLVPRLRALLEARAPLPDSSAILPYVEVCLDATPQEEPRRLLDLIGHLDALITEHADGDPDPGR